MAVEKQSGIGQSLLPRLLPALLLACAYSVSADLNNDLPAATQGDHRVSDTVRGRQTPTVAASNASAAQGKQIAFSKRLGVEVFAEDGGAGWCRPELRLRVVAQDAAFFQSPELADLMRKAGSEAIAKKCAAAEKALIAGFTKASTEPVFSGQASRSDGWAVAAAASAALPGRGAPPTEFFTAAERGELATIDRFLVKGVDVNARDARGETALMKASQNAQTLLVYALLAKGADAKATNQDGRTALLYAALVGRLEVVEALLDGGAEVNARSNDGATALIIAAEGGHDAVLKVLLARGADGNARDKYGQTALMGAAALGQGTAVQVLLDGGADVNARANDDATALIFASQAGHAMVVQTLLDRGVTMEAGNSVGRTALMAAAEKGHDAVVRVLLAKGAAVNASGRDGGTALMLAAQHGHRAVVEALLGGGAAVNLRGNEGATALSLAAWDGHREIVELLLGKGAEVDVRNNDGMTALSNAAGNGHDAIVRALLAKQPDVNAKNKYGVTALMLAAAKGHTEVAKDLLGGGADVNARAEDGSTALMAAAQGGHSTIVQLLLGSGADVSATTHDGVTAATLAAKNGHNAVVQLLRAAAAGGAGKAKGATLSYAQWEKCRDRAAASADPFYGRQGMEEQINRQCGEPPVREAGTEKGIGVRPSDLVRSKTWKKKFMDVTGDQYAAFLKRLDVASETVLEDGWIVGEGQAPHAGTIDEAALAIEARTGRVFAAMMVGGSRIYGLGFGESWANAPPPLQRWARERGLKEATNLAKGSSSSAATPKEPMRSDIPKPFQGTWDPAERCKPDAESDSRIIVERTRIKYWEADCRLIEVIAADANNFSGRFDCEGEGNRWTKPVSLSIDNGKLIHKSKQTRWPVLFRCE